MSAALNVQSSTLNVQRSINDLPNAGRGLLTPGAGGGEASDAGAAGPVGVLSAQSGGPARFVSTPQSRAAGRGPFTCAYWDYLRRITPNEPLAEKYGLSEVDAEVIRYQCNIQFNEQVFKRGLAQNRALHGEKGTK